MASSFILAMPAKPWPPEVIVRPWTWTSMSSQRAKLSEMRWNDAGSAALKLPRVWSENTTPQPNVASGALRSRTTMST